MAVIEHAAL